MKRGLTLVAALLWAAAPAGAQTGGAEVTAVEVTYPTVRLELLVPPEVADGSAGGNLVAVASDRPVPTEEIDDRLADRGSSWRALEGEALRQWVGDAPVLTDDYAPVDQLLTPYGT